MEFVMIMREVEFNCTLVLGDYYIVNGRLCQFIKVTRKGFNFLDVNRHDCLRRNHFYDPRFYGRGVKVPEGIREIKIIKPGYMEIEPTRKAVGM